MLVPGRRAATQNEVSSSGAPVVPVVAQFDASCGTPASINFSMLMTAIEMQSPWLVTIQGNPCKGHRIGPRVLVQACACNNHGLNKGVSQPPNHSPTSTHQAHRRWRRGCRAGGA